MLKLDRALAPGLIVALATATVADTLSIVDTKPGTFIDISSTGINLGLSGDLETTITTTISNAIFPGGDVVVANNGGLGFAGPPDPNLAPVNEPIPSPNAFGGSQSVLAFWDDIGNTLGAVYYQNQIGRLIVQWHEKQFDGRPGGGTITFQVQILANVNPADPIYAQIIYTDVEQPRPGGGASATIGYQDGSAGNNDVQWSFNTAGAVSDGTVLSLVPEPAALALLALGGLALGRRL